MAVTTTVESPTHRSAVNLGTMLSHYGSRGSIGAEAIEYIQKIRDIVEDPSHQISIVVKKLDTDGYAFIYDGSAVILSIATEAMVNIHGMLTDNKLKSIAARFREKFKDTKILKIVACNRFMFSKSAQMADYISQILEGESDDSMKSFNITDLGNFIVNVNTNLSEVKNFFATYSPNATTKTDFGFVISLIDKAEFGNRNAHPDDSPMFGVSGYVEFVKDRSNTMFIPLVHVTDICSVLPTPKILSLAIPMIAEFFINHGLWKQPYSTGAADSKINIGNLLIDPATSKPCEVKNEYDLRKMFAEHIAQPMLVIDVPSGSASIPGIEHLTNSGGLEIVKYVEDFLKYSEKIKINLPKIMSQNVLREIIGVAETSKTANPEGIVDSREMTYLFAVSRLKFSNKIEQLLYRPEDPIQRYELVRELFAEVHPTNMVITTMLTNDFIRACGEIVSSMLNINLPTATSIPTVPLQGLTSNAYQPGAAMFGNTAPRQFYTGGYLY